MQSQLEKMERDAIPMAEIRNYIDVLMKDNRMSAMKIYALENEVALLRQRAEDSKRISSTNDVLILEKMSEVDEFMVELRRRNDDEQRSMQNQNTIDPHQQRLQHSQQPSEAALVKELNHKLTTLEFEVKSMKHIVTETEDKCDRLDSIARQTKRMSHQCKQRLDDMVGNVEDQVKFRNIQNFRGHLLWRIDNFRTRLNEAKENDVTLQSPIFCNRQYGYTLRVSEIFLL